MSPRSSNDDIRSRFLKATKMAEHGAGSASIVRATLSSNCGQCGEASADAEGKTETPLSERESRADSTARIKRLFIFKWSLGDNLIKGVDRCMAGCSDTLLLGAHTAGVCIVSLT